MTFVFVVNRLDANQLLTLANALAHLDPFARLDLRSVYTLGGQSQDPRATNFCDLRHTTHSDEAGGIGYSQ
jgi:hypothetical protein